MTEIKLDLKEGSSGLWKVEQFTVSRKAADFERMRSIVKGSGRGVPEGTYHRLTRNGSTIMSNTPDEIGDCSEFIDEASGNVLINGLGLGVVLEAIMDKVDHVTVIENSPDVIKLVAQHYLDKYPGKLEIIEADAYTYKSPKGVKYDCVWHDIWDDICTDNLRGMKKLHRKYDRKTNWQASWCRGACEYHRERNKQGYW